MERIKIADPRFENIKLLNNKHDTYYDFIMSDNYINHPNITKFEAEWSKHTGFKHVMLVTSGTAALQLAYNAAFYRLRGPIIEFGQTLKSNYKVLLPNNNYHADFSAVTWCGFSDIAYTISSYNYDYKCSYDTVALKGVIEDNVVLNFTHLYGIPVTPNFIKNCIKELKDKNIVIVEDCSHAHYSNINYTGDLCIWSCYPTKILGALGNAGIIATNDDDLAFYIRSLINQGELPGIRYNPQWKGTNARGDAIQAAFLSIKLEHKQKVIDHRNMITSYYECLHSSLTFSNKDACYYAYPLLFSSEQVRDKIKSELEAENIETAIYYPVSTNSIMNKLYNLPYNDKDFVGRRMLCLPVHLGMTKEDAHRVKFAVVKAEDKWGI